VAELPGKKKYIPPYTPRSSLSSNNNSATTSTFPPKPTDLEIVQTDQKTIATSSLNNNLTSSCPPKEVKPADRCPTYNSAKSAAVNIPVKPVCQGNTTPLPKSAPANRPVKPVSQETATPLPKDHKAVKTPSSLSISVVNQTPNIKSSANLNQTDMTTPKQSHHQQQQQLIRSKPTSSKSKRSRARMTEEELNTSCKFILSYVLFLFYLDYYILVKD
jgi:hypothetical protein